MNLNKSEIYNELEKRNTDSSKFYIENIKTIYNMSSKLLGRLQKIFPNYTLHDITHSENVLEIMDSLVDKYSELSDLELTLLIASALTHDLGMFASDKEIDSIKTGKLVIGTRKFDKVLERLQDEGSALEECLRPEHAKRSRYIITEYLSKENKKIFYVHHTEHDFLDLLSLVNEAHNESLEWIKDKLTNRQMIGKEIINGQYIATILRLADLLDIDDRRAPVIIQNLLNLPRRSVTEWRKHHIITNHRKVELNTRTNKYRIFFDGHTDDADLYRQILSYINYVEEQLELSIEFCSRMFVEEKYQLNFDQRIRNAIKTDGFNVADFKLKLDYKAVTELLMGENIYGSKEYGIRELMQNAFDACKVAESYRKRNSYDDYQAKITILWDEDTQKFILRDNGSGMSEDIIKNYFLNIGVSYYKSDDFFYSDTEVKPIGNYGIGFLACFMLSENVKIVSKHIHKNQTIEISLKRDSEYIELTRSESMNSHGTEIFLDLEQVKKVFPTPETLEDFITKNFLKTDITIICNIINGTEHRISEITCPEIIKASDEAKADDYSNLSDYLTDISLYVKFKSSSPKVFNSLMELHDEICYVVKHDANGDIHLDVVDEDTNALDILENGTINFIEVPLIIGTNMEEALIYADNDFEEALSHVENKIIKVYYHPDHFSINLWVEGMDNYVLESTKTYQYLTYIDIQNVCGIFSEYGDYIEISRKKYNIIHSENGQFIKYIDHSDNHEARKNYSFPTMYLNQNMSFYIKNILIKNFSFELLPIISGIDIEDIAINSYNDKIIPNISRNNFNATLHREISYALSKAINLYSIKTCNDRNLEVFDLYYKKFFDSESELLEEQNLQ